MGGTRSRITEKERNERSEAVAYGLASVQMEGLEPSEAAKSITARFVAGQIDEEETVAEVQALNAREHGSVPVSGD